MLSIRERLKLIKWTKKKKLFIIIALVIIIVPAVFIYNSKQAKPTTGDVSTVKVQRGTIEHTIDGSGTLKPSERYALKTWAGGTVTEVMVAAGTQVKKGEPLMRIQNDELESLAKQAYLEWEVSQSELDEMTGPRSDTDYELRTAELKVEQYRIALEDAKEERDKLVLKAPFDGTILKTELNLDQRVNSGEQAVEFVTTDKIEVVANFSDSNVSLLGPGMEATVYVTGLSKTYKGKVKEIAFEGDTDSTSASGTFEVIISVENPDKLLRSGMKVHTNVIIYQDEEKEEFMYRGASGYTRYAETEDIKTEVSGTVAEIYRKPGEKVYKDEPILRLVNDELDRKVRETEIQLAIAEEDLDQLIYPEEDIIKEQQARVEQNYQKVLSAQNKLDTLNVTAPIDGVVVSISVNPGDELGDDDTSAGQELLVVCNFEKNYLEIPVDELDINQIDFGQEAAVKIDALPNAAAIGRVTGIAQEGTTNNDITNYPVTIEVGYVEGIKGGMSATATITLEKKENVLRIPAEALITNGNRTMVRVMENGQPQMRPIKTGINTGRWVEIVEGLTEGEEVVAAMVDGTNGQQQMMRMPGIGGPGGTVNIRRAN